MMDIINKYMLNLSIRRTKLIINLRTLYRTHLRALIGISILAVLICLMGILPYVFTLDPYSSSEHLLATPGFMSIDQKHYLLGTDDLGRDVLSRLIYGARNTMGVGLSVVILSLIIGSFLGLLSSVYGGFLGVVVGYFTDVIMSFPSILFAILLFAILGPGIPTAVIAVTIITIPGFISVAKKLAAEEMSKDYIMAARAAGLSRFRILLSELLPNCLPAILVQSTFAFSDAILTISILGFLRIGVSPPMAEWGSMLADAHQFIESNPTLVIFPGLCVFFTVLAANLLGDQLLDKLRRT